MAGRPVRSCSLLHPPPRTLQRKLALLTCSPLPCKVTPAGKEKGRCKPRTVLVSSRDWGGQAPWKAPHSWPQASRRLLQPYVPIHHLAGQAHGTPNCGGDTEAWAPDTPSGAVHLGPKHTDGDSCSLSSCRLS